MAESIMLEGVLWASLQGWLMGLVFFRGGQCGQSAGLVIFGAGAAIFTGHKTKKIFLSFLVLSVLSLVLNQSKNTVWVRPSLYSGHSVWRMGSASLPGWK